jgi:hypothetical protein
VHPGDDRRVPAGLTARPGCPRPPLPARQAVLLGVRLAADKSGCGLQTVSDLLSRGPGQMHDTTPPPIIDDLRHSASDASCPRCDRSGAPILSASSRIDACMGRNNPPMGTAWRPPPGRKAGRRKTGARYCRLPASRLPPIRCRHVQIPAVHAFDAKVTFSSKNRKTQVLIHRFAVALDSAVAVIRSASRGVAAGCSGCPGPQRAR